MKQGCLGDHRGGDKVAPHAGAWIETTILLILHIKDGRPPRGGVD